MIPSSRQFASLTSDAVAALDPLTSVIVLPLGATEQHGPHLPLGTDTMIGQTLISQTFEYLDPDIPALALAALEISNSTEHEDALGTLSYGRTLTFELIIELGRSLHRAGLKKLVILNAHGGNVGVMVDAAHALRAEFGMLCAYTNWARLGLPPGTIDEERRGVDIHGGEIETSIMLEARPDLVEMSERADFESLQSHMSADYELLRAYGPVGMGWMGTDLNPAGAVGNAQAASAAKGRSIIAHQAQRAARLIAEVSHYKPSWF
ncbi:MAG: creatininase family protein [Pseudomonadota bacterium]